MSSGSTDGRQIKIYSSTEKVLVTAESSRQSQGQTGGTSPNKGQFLLTAGVRAHIIFVLYPHCTAAVVVLFFRNLIVHVSVRWVVLALWCSTEGLNTPQAPRSQVGV